MYPKAKVLVSCWRNVSAFSQPNTHYYEPLTSCFPLICPQALIQRCQHIPKGRVPFNHISSTFGFYCPPISMSRNIKPLIRANLDLGPTEHAAWHDDLLSLTFVWPCLDNWPLPSVLSSSPRKSIGQAVIEILSPACTSKGYRRGGHQLTRSGCVGSHQRHWPRKWIRTSNQLL